MTRLLCISLCVSGVLLPSSAVATEIVCLCPQEVLWEDDEETSVYWAYRYSRESGDTDCTDDDVEPTLHYDAPNYPYLPAPYCGAGDRCAKCILTGGGAEVSHLPGSDYALKAWDSGHGLGPKWDLVRTIYAEFTTAKNAAPRCAKLFLLTHLETRMMMGFGFEIGRPDPSQVDPATLIRIGPNRCPPMRVHYKTRITVTDNDGSAREEDVVRDCVTSAVRRFTLGNVPYFVRAVYDGADQSASANPETTQPTTNKNAADTVPTKEKAIAEDAGKPDCCAGTSKPSEGGRP